MPLDPCTVGVAVLIAALFTMILAHYDRWHSPQEYNHLTLKGDKTK
jgi:hypothetical protein